MKKNMPEPVEIWGAAAGRRSTEGAAYGAFSIREYPTVEAARQSVEEGHWMQVAVAFKRKADGKRVRVNL